MSIETLLTLGLTGALLAVAFVLRLVVLTLLGVGLRLAGKGTSWLRPQRGPRGPRPERQPKRREVGVALRPRVAAAAGKTRAGMATVGAGLRSGGAAARPALSSAGTGLAAIGTTILAVAASIWAAAARGAADLESWADSTNERLAPAMADVRSGARRSLADMGKYVVAGIATVQHLVLLVARWLRTLWTERAGSREEPAPPRRVIDLDRDPHGHPVDRPASRRGHSVGV